MITIRTDDQRSQKVLFTVLHKMVLTLAFVDETIVCDHSNENY